MVVFDEHQVIALRIDHLPAEIALAEYGIAGDQTPLENQTLEQSKGGFVLVGLVLTAVGDGRLPSVRPDSCASSESRCTAFWRPSKLPRADLPSRA